MRGMQIVTVAFIVWLLAMALIGVVVGVALLVR
jgi:hypothetical protein